jgi:ammonia channel protein AmtB
LQSAPFKKILISCIFYFNKLANLPLKNMSKGIVYPIVCHWAWTPEGWLTVLGYKDFCGSGVVHLVGGSCAIVAAILLKPRYGRWKKLENESDIHFEAHSTPVRKIKMLKIV